MNYISINDLNNDILRNLYKIPNPDLIIGIPRSGLMVANLLSLYFNVPITTIDLFIQDKKTLGHGNSRPIYEKEIKNILVVDNSCHSGKSMFNIKSKLEQYKQYNVTYFACYVSSLGVKSVDLIAEL